MVMGMYNSNCVIYKWHSVDNIIITDIKLLLINNTIIINICMIYFINKGGEMRMIPKLDNILMFPCYINTLVINYWLSM